MSARVLIVDDEQAVAWALCQAMIEEGYDAVAVNSGAEALAAFSDGGFHVVFTDLKMPGMDGIDLVRKLREQRCRAKVIVMTAYGTLETAVEALRLGASEYLIKPVNIEAARKAAAVAIETYSRDAASSRSGADQATHARITPYAHAADVQRQVVLDVKQGAEPGSFSDLLRIGRAKYVIAAGEVLRQGPETATYTLMVKSYLRSVATEGRPAPEAVRRLNGLMLADGLAGAGTSLFYGIYDAEERRLSYVSTGPAHRFRLASGHGTCEALSTTGPPLGILDDVDLHEASLAMEAEDRLILISGVTPLLGELPGEIVDLAGCECSIAEMTRKWIGSLAGVSGPYQDPTVAVVTFGSPGRHVHEEQLLLRCDANALGSVRACAEQFAKRAGLKYEEKHTLITAAMEAVINAIRHAYDGNDGGRLSVRFVRSSEQVQVDVWDEGRGFDPVAYQSPGTTGYDDLMRTAGRGILLMRSMMHDVDITSQHNNGTRVRMLLNLGDTRSFAA